MSAIRAIDTHKITGIQWPLIMGLSSTFGFVKYLLITVNFINRRYDNEGSWAIYWLTSNG